MQNPPEIFHFDTKQQGILEQIARGEYSLLFDIPVQYCDDFNFMLEVFKRIRITDLEYENSTSGYYLLASDKLQNNREFALQAVKEETNFFRNLPEALRNDDEILKTVLEKTSDKDFYFYASPRLQQKHPKPTSPLLELFLEKSEEEILNALSTQPNLYLTLKPNQKSNLQFIFFTVNSIVDTSRFVDVLFEVSLELHNLSKKMNGKSCFPLETGESFWLSKPILVEKATALHSQFVHDELKAQTIAQPTPHPQKKPSKPQRI